MKFRVYCRISQLSILVLLSILIGVFSLADEDEDWRKQRTDKLTEKQGLEQKRLQVSEQEESLLRDLQQLDLALFHGEKELQQYERQMDSNQSLLENLHTESLKLQETSQHYSQRAALRIRNIYKLRYHGNSLSPIKLLLNSEGIGEWLIRYQYLRSITEADKHLVQDIVDQHNAKLQIQQEVAEKRQELHVASQLARQSREELLQRRKERRELLRELQEDKDAYDQAIRELEQQIGELERELGEFSESSISSTAYGISPRNQGELPWPVDGKQIANVNKASHGITVRAPLGTEIRAVADGLVRQVEWILGYGSVMMLDHGDAYFSIYAHLSEALTEEGARVAQGQVIAKVGETGSLAGPVLYFEIWKGKTPLDTSKWLQRKAN